MKPAMAQRDFVIRNVNCCERANALTEHELFPKFWIGPEKLCSARSFQRGESIWQIS